VAKTSMRPGTCLFRPRANDEYLDDPP
jgi:hypothetical protein